MNILDDNIPPQKPSENKNSKNTGNSLITLGAIILVIVFVTVMKGGLNIPSYIYDNYSFSTDFNAVYYLGLLFLPVVIAIYLIVIGKRFETLPKDDNSDYASKILRLNTQLLFTILIWVILVAGFFMLYLTF